MPNSYVPDYLKISPAPTVHYKQGGFVSALHELVSPSYPFGFYESTLIRTGENPEWAVLAFHPRSVNLENQELAAKGRQKDLTAAVKDLQDKGFSVKQIELERMVDEL